MLPSVLSGKHVARDEACLLLKHFYLLADSLSIPHPPSSPQHKKGAQKHAAYTDIYDRVLDDARPYQMRFTAEVPMARLNRVWRSYI
jgi:hypothetical protein